MISLGNCVVVEEGEDCADAVVPSCLVSPAPSLLDPMHPSHSLFGHGDVMSTNVLARLHAMKPSSSVCRMMMKRFRVHLEWVYFEVESTGPTKGTSGELTPLLHQGTWPCTRMDSWVVPPVGGHQSWRMSGEMNASRGT